LPLASVASAAERRIDLLLLLCRPADGFAKVLTKETKGVEPVPVSFFPLTGRLVTLAPQQNGAADSE